MMLLTIKYNFKTRALSNFPRGLPGRYRPADFTVTDSSAHVSHAMF
jgi:hypothetical protein